MTSSADNSTIRRSVSSKLARPASLAGTAMTPASAISSTCARNLSEPGPSHDDAAKTRPDYRKAKASMASIAARRPSRFSSISFSVAGDTSTVRHGGMEVDHG